MKQIIIDGNNFSNEEEFYCEIDKLLTKDLGWKTGHNLDAFNDLLRGGFGVHEPGEELNITWINAAKSRNELGEELFNTIVDIILDSDNSGHECKLQICEGQKMRDMLAELLYARKLKIYKENEFEDLLFTLENSNAGNTIDWDLGAGEEWAFVNNDTFSVMLNRRIGICFVRGTLDEFTAFCLGQCKCVSVDGFDIKEWHVNLADLKKSIPEIVWGISEEGVDPNCFMLLDFYVATV